MTDDLLKELCKAMGMSEALVPALKEFCVTIYKHGYQDGISDTVAELRKRVNTNA